LVGGWITYLINMKMTVKNNNIADSVHYEKDKSLVPFLMVCEGIDFLGVEARGEIVFFKFSPNSLVNKAIEQFYRRIAPLVQPKDLLDAVERFKKEVYRTKENYG